MKNLFKGFKNPFEVIRKEILSWWVKRKLVKRREFDYEIELLNEEWIVKRIQDGQTGRRKELTECQARIKELDMFIKHFKNKRK